MYICMYIYIYIYIYIYVSWRILSHASLRMYTYFHCLLMGRGETKEVSE